MHGFSLFYFMRFRSIYHAAKVGTSIATCFRELGRNCRRTISLQYAKPASKTVDVSQFLPDKIRNFGIIAHVDHGKSTLADRLLESVVISELKDLVTLNFGNIVTGTIGTSSENKQVLDKLQVERERGITVKAQTASIVHTYQDVEYLLNLIDTPGHVDFSYEVSRSLSACQGVVLLVDATQGVQAQTLSNFYLTLEMEKKVIPVLNKVDLKTANVMAVCQEMENFFGIKPEEIICISAKTGQNVSQVLDAIVTQLPSPKEEYLDHCTSDGPFKALVFDSSYEAYRGVNANLAVVSGKIKVGDKITSTFLKTSPKSKASYEVKEVGLLRPDFLPTGILYAGQVGYMFCGMKSISEARIGDTFHHVGCEVEPFDGFKQPKPMVFGSFYPNEQSEFIRLRSAIDRLVLNDSSVSVAPSNSDALGAGFRLGFLGLLHMDVFKQRLEQEYDASVISTTPTVPYKAILSSPTAIKKHGGKEVIISTASDFPDLITVERFLQPMVTGTIMAPARYHDAISELCQARSGEELGVTYISEDRIVMNYKFPLSEIIVDFYDKLKSKTSGYGSFDYEDAGYEESKLVRLDITLNGTIVPELSSVFNEDKVSSLGRQICERLKESIPQQLFLITIQASVGSKIIASEKIKALRKDVTAKCYGGDITRRLKLLRNQREGKKRMRQIGKVNVPKDALVKVLQE